jgi:hypothetical protein
MRLGRAVIQSNTKLAGVVVMFSTTTPPLPKVRRFVSLSPATSTMSIDSVDYYVTPSTIPKLHSPMSIDRIDYSALHRLVSFSIQAHLWHGSCRFRAVTHPIPFRKPISPATH